MDYLALDVGGSAIKYGLIDEDGNIKEKDEVPAPHDSIEQFIDTITQLYKKYEGQVKGIGISMPGAIDPIKGYAYTGGAYKYIKDMHIVNMLQENIPLPITIGNDAKCAANAEIGFGCLRDVEDAAVVILGTGIGGCIVQGGKVHVGKHFSSGEFSWMRTNGENGLDFKDSWASKNGISGLLKSVQDARGNDEILNGKEIFALANSGDEDVLKGLNKFCKELAIQLFNLQSLFDPEKIAIGGGISVQPLLLELTDKHIQEMFEVAGPLSPIARPNVVLCEFNNDANLLGAYYQLKSTMVNA